MADATSYNALPIPDFPVAQEHFTELTSSTLSADVALRPDAWFSYLRDAGAYQTNLTRLCCKHEPTIATLERELLNTNKQLVQALTTHTTSPQASRSPKHPDPDKFNGNRAELEPFLAQLRTKLALNKDHFPSENMKIFYAISRLEGQAMRQVMPHIKLDNTTDYSTVNDLIQTLTVAFGDPDKQTTAQRELRTLKQKNTDLSTQRWAPDTGFDQHSLKSFLSDSISAELKQAMVTQIVPTDLDEYIALLQRFDNNLRAIPTSRPSVIRSGSSFSTGRARSQFLSYAGSSTSASTPSTSAFITAADSASNHPAQNLGPMSMDLSNIRKGPVPPEEKLRRRALNLCNYCGGNGHQAPTCPTFRCYNCGGIGHGAQGCTKPRKQRLQEFSLIDIGMPEEQGKD